MVPKNRIKTKKHLVWRALWRRLLEPRMWTSLFLRCKKIPVCWFFVKFFPIFVIKTIFYGLDLDPDLLWSKKRLDPHTVSGFSKMPGSGLRLSESILKSQTMRNYWDETSTLGILYLYWVRFLAREFLVENISLGCWASVNWYIQM